LPKRVRGNQKKINGGKEETLDVSHDNERIGKRDEVGTEGGSPEGDRSEGFLRGTRVTYQSKAGESRTNFLSGEERGEWKHLSRVVPVDKRKKLKKRSVER